MTNNPPQNLTAAEERIIEQIAYEMSPYFSSWQGAFGTFLGISSDLFLILPALLIGWFSAKGAGWTLRALLHGCLVAFALILTKAAILPTLTVEAALVPFITAPFLALVAAAARRALLQEMFKRRPGS